MSQLILTEEEKAAATFLELPDETVGHVVKHTAIQFIQTDQEKERLGIMSACLIITGMMHDANAEETTIKLEGTTTSTEHTGDWEITVRRIKKP